MFQTEIDKIIDFDLDNFYLDVKFLEQVKIGHQESEFLFQLVNLDQLEPVAVGR